MLVWISLVEMVKEKAIPRWVHWAVEFVAFMVAYLEGENIAHALHIYEPLFVIAVAFGVFLATALFLSIIVAMYFV